MTQGQKQIVLPGHHRRGSSTARAARGCRDCLPHTASIVDDICLVKSMHTDAGQPRPRRHVLLHRRRAARPAGDRVVADATASAAPTRTCPPFVVMTSRDKENTCGQLFYDHYWGSGFLPSRYQGVRIRSSGDPVLYLSNPDRREPRDPPRHARRPREAQRDEARRARRPGDRHAHRAVRDGLPHAGERARAVRPLDRAEGSARHVRPRRARPGQLRRQLPARPAARGEGRALRAAHARRLGPPPQPAHAVQDPVPGHRPAVAPRW